MKKYINIKKFKDLSDTEKESGDYLVSKDFKIDASENDLTATFIITTGNPDTDNDIINPDGLDVSVYMNNPVVLWQHNRDLPPVGKCISINKINNGWVASVQFMPKEIDPESFRIFQMVKNGFLNAVSIGFIPKDLEPNNLNGYNISKSILYEFSIVTVPANSECLIVPEKSLDDTPLIDSLIEDTEDKIDELTSDIENKLSQLDITKIKLKFNLHKNE